MSNKAPAKFFVTCVLLVAILVLASGCKKENNSSKAQTDYSSMPAKADNLTHINEDLFHPISDAVEKTYFENFIDYEKTHKITGSFDFDGDGKSENFAVNYPQSKNGSTATEITLGDDCVYEHLLGVSGVYSLKLNEKTSESVLCVVEYNTNNYIYSHFYGYKDGSIVSLGQVDGSFKLDSKRQPLSHEYNEQILVDGAGRLIPRYALVKYISPNIVLNIYKYSPEKITKMALDPNAFLSDEYTVTGDTKPYFEEGNYNSANYQPKCNDKDKFTLKKGETIKLINISSKATNQEAALVRLQSGKQGLLYYFLNP